MRILCVPRGRRESEQRASKGDDRRLHLPTVRRRRVRIGSAALAVGVALVVSGLAFGARAGSLDHSFGGDGKVLMKDLTGYAQSVHVGRHGRIVAAGFAGNRFAPGARIAVARLRSDGKPDPSFSHDGIKRTKFGSLSMAQDVALTHGGGIVVAGKTCSSKTNCEAAVVRYTRRGRLKRSFGSHGKVALDYENGQGDDHASAIAIDPNGGFFVAGGGCLNTVPSCDVAVTRLNRNGAVDHHFTHGLGKAAFFDFAQGPPGCSRSTGATSMRVDAKGRVVVAGTCDGHDVGLLRLRHDGHLDRSFGNKGIIHTDLGFGDGADDVGIDSHGRIDVSGATSQGGNYAVARFKPSGNLDRSFGNGGKTSAPVGRPDNELSLDRHGRIVVGGGVAQGFLFARFHESGRLDRSFGHDGSAEVGKDLGYGYGLSVTTDRHDRIVASGFKKRRFTLVRLHG
jgi:uncharacterized delta-60 repeat protein